MAQHDYVIANGTGAAVRSDINNGLAAIVSNNSGATAPSTTYAYQWWADTTTGLLKLRNAANNAWITLFQLDGEWSTLAVENGSAAAPSIYFKDSGTDTGVYSPGTDQVAISTAGTGRLFVNASGNVGLGTGSPTENLDVVDTETASNVAVLARNLATTGNSNALFGLRGNNNAVRANWFLDGLGSVFVSAGAILYTETNHPLMFGTNNAERMRLTSTGLGIGTTSPSGRLTIENDAALNEIEFTGSNYTNIYSSTTQGFDIGISNGSSTGPLRFLTANAERARITSDGKLLVGTSTARSVGSVTAGVEIEGTGYSTSSLSLTCNSSSGEVPTINLGRSNGSSIGSNTGGLAAGDDLGYITFSAADGTDLNSRAAWILCEIDGATSGDDVPGRLVFSTTADGASSPTERMRISNSGWVSLKAGTNSVTTAGNIYLNPDGNATNVPFIGTGGASSSNGDACYAVYSTSLGQYQFYVGYGGTVYARSTSISSLSDQREKQNIQDLDVGLSEILALQPRRFDWKDGSGQNIAGFVAQEVELVLPDLVEDYQFNESETRKSLKMGDMIPALVKAIQEQQAIIAELQAEVASLKAS
jgi:hypothetical protein